MSSHDTTVNENPYVLFDELKDHKDQFLSRFTTGNYIVLMIMLALMIYIITFVSFFFTLIIGTIAIGLFISYKNFNFIFHKQITSYSVEVISKFRKLIHITESDKYETKEDKIFKLVNI